MFVPVHKWYSVAALEHIIKALEHCRTFSYLETNNATGPGIEDPSSLDSKRILYF